MKLRRTISWLAACSALLALAALTIISATCGGTGLRKPAGTTPVVTESTGTTEWVHTWDGGELDYAQALAVDDKGNTYVVGSTDGFGTGLRDALLLKYSRMGDLIWQKAWGGSRIDYARGVGLGVTGEVFVAGKTSSHGAGSEDAFLLKYSADGNLLWQKTWGGTYRDYTTALAVDRRGNVYVAGETYSFDCGPQYDDPFLEGYLSAPDVFLLRYSSAGDLVWQRTWGGSDCDRTRTLAVDESGNVFIAGVTSSFGASSMESFLLKYSPGGGLLWQRTWGGDWREDISALAADVSGNIYMAGVISDHSAADYDAYFLKYSPHGTLVWQKTWDGAYDEMPRSLAVDGVGNIYMVGLIRNIMITEEDYAIVFNGFLLEFSPSGNILSQRTWAVDSSTRFNDIRIDRNGIIYICGRAPDALGEWKEVSGVLSSLSGTETTPEGVEGIPEGTETIPEGVETEPEGVIDEGGILIMKYDPS